MQLYDAPNCDYEPPKNFQQNFGNPYDCPEGFYNASMMSSVGYSQVADYSAHMGAKGQGPPQPQLLPGQIIAQQAQQQQMMMAQQGAYGKPKIFTFVIINIWNSGQYPQPHAEYSTDTVIYKGGPPNGNMRGPLPNVRFLSFWHYVFTIYKTFP